MQLYTVGTYYSKTGLSYSDLIYLYEDTPIHIGTQISAFIDTINYLIIDKNYFDTFYSDTLVMQTFIDKSGRVETIFLTNPLIYEIEQKTFLALSKSKFNQLSINGTPSKYSLMIKYFFKNDSTFISIINNNIPEESMLKKFSVKTDNITDSENTSNQPILIHKETPVYPLQSRINGIEGLVILTIIIDKQGNVIDAKVQKSPDKLIAKASIAAAFKCKFTPAKVNGKPVKVKMSIPFNFKLN